MPVVLSKDEVVDFLRAVSSLMAPLALTTAYAAGLGVSEICRPRANDTDSSKDGNPHHPLRPHSPPRHAVPELLGILGSYWRLARPKDILFPARNSDKSIAPQVLRSVCRSWRWVYARRRPHDSEI